MRILISDYSGHPFQVQLSKQLASRGHDVLHISSDSFQTPKGKLKADANDPASFTSVGVTTRTPFAKNSFFKRRRQEIEIGRRIAAHVDDFRPDVVISSNAPMDTQRHIQRAAQAIDAKFIFWIQDLWGEAIFRILRAKLGPIGWAIGRYYQRLEARMIRNSDHSVLIAPEFKSAVSQLAGVAETDLTVIENWAPLDEIPLGERDNHWSKAHLRETGFRAVYSGTLGFKHNPELLMELAREIDGDIIVFSEGPAADNLKLEAEAEGLRNLKVSGWLPFEILPDALASADILVVILEPDAGMFSVPSKVLTYACAGRPILASIPHGNLAARLIQENDFGLVVQPHDVSGFVQAAKQLWRDREDRLSKGCAARRYAERTFDIDVITSKFEAIIDRISAKNGECPNE